MRFSRSSNYNTGNYYRPTLFGGFSFFPPVIKALLVSNVGVFLVFVFFGNFHFGKIDLGTLLDKLFALFPLGYGFQIWQLFTYMFIHASFMHLFFNMLALWMFGMEIENTWGSKKFLTYYLTCGVGAGLSNLFLAPLFSAVGPTVGASGAIYGVLLAFGLMFPDRYVFLFPFFVPLKAKYFVAFYILLEVFSLGAQDGIAHLAHLGGAAVGYVFLMIDWRQIPLAGIFHRLRESRTFARYSRSYQRGDVEDIADARYYDITNPRDEEEISQECIDEILDKISKAGYQSLTEDEKRILFEASKKLN